MAIGPRVKSVTATAAARDVMVVKCVCERCRTPYAYEHAITASVSHTAHLKPEISWKSGQGT